MNEKKKGNLSITLLKVFLPIISGLIILAIVGLIMVENLRAEYWSLCFAYFVPPFGKESIIPAGIIAGIHPLIMALSIALVDILTAIFLYWNYDFAKKIPILGNFMLKVENIGKNSSDKYSWIKPLRFIGIVLFVMVPFQGSGGLVGSIVGRLIGMKPLNTCIAISIGAIIGTMLVAYFTDAIKSVFISNFLLGLLIIIILVIIGLMVLIYKKNKKNNKN
jgi:uncharacterized membrane protein